MDPLVLYIFKSVIAGGILYGYYHAFLRNKRFHSYNRFYLLSAMVVSLLVPLAHFEWYITPVSQSSRFNHFLTLISSKDKTHSFYINTSWVFLSCAGMVSILLFSILLSKICWINNVKRKYKSKTMQGFYLIEIPLKQAPFSFLDNLFWKQGMSFHDENGKKIFTHELTHIKQRHTYDKLFIQIVVCLCWMNPFYWLIQRELNIIHEFIADAASIYENDVESFAQMLLHCHNEGRYLEPSHSFSQSPIKRRLMMITIPKKNIHSYAGRILAVALTLMVIVMLPVAFYRTQSNQPTQQKERAQKLKDEQKAIEAATGSKATEKTGKS